MAGMELGLGAAGLIFTVVVWAVGLYVLYWVIRMGVRAGMMDAWKRRTELDRERGGAVPQAQSPTRSAAVATPPPASGGEPGSRI